MHKELQDISTVYVEKILVKLCQIVLRVKLGDRVFVVVISIPIRVTDGPRRIQAMW